MIDMSPENAQKFGLVMQLIENESSPAAMAVRALLDKIVEEIKADTPLGLLAKDFLIKACDLKDPLYTDLDPMLKQSIAGMFKTVRMMVEE